MRAFQTKVVSGQQRKPNSIPRMPRPFLSVFWRARTRTLILAQFRILFQQALALGLIQFKMLPRLFDIGQLEVVNGKLLLIRQTHAAVFTDASCPRTAAPKNANIRL